MTMRSSSMSLFCIVLFLVSSPHHQQAQNSPDANTKDQPQPHSQDPPNSPNEKESKGAPAPGDRKTGPKEDDLKPESPVPLPQATPGALDGAIWDTLVNPQPGQFGSPIENIEEPPSISVSPDPEESQSADSSSEEQILPGGAADLGPEESITSEETEQKIGDASSSSSPSGPEPQIPVPLPKLIPNKSESDSIPSFSEWTQLQLSQKEELTTNNIQNPKNKIALQLQQQNQEGRNFASPKCGAKIINSNPESHNPSGVLSSSLDDYMLNRCRDNIWFIIELCEPVKLELISLGNLELFSSNPKEYEFGISDRYPTRDWKNFGPFTAPDQRILHPFHLPQTNSTFGKFLRVIVKSHYGKEHYCPLNLIKVFGKSEYDVLESETSHSEDEESSRAAAAEEELSKFGNIQGQDEHKNSIIDSARDVVIDIYKKAAGVLVNSKGKEEHSPGPGPDENPQTFFNSGNTSSNCITLTQCLPDTIPDRTNVIQNLSCHRTLLNWLKGQLPWIEWSLDCHDLLQNTSFGSVSRLEGLLVAIYGQNVIQSLCHFVRPILSCPQNELVDNNLVQLTSGLPNFTKEDNAGAGHGGNNSSIGGSQTPSASTTNGKNGNGNGTGAGGNSQQIPISVAPPPNVHPARAQENPFHPTSEDSFIQQSSNQKESVFVRLSNRVKNLERNQSLSSGYLEELSRRFKKQNEEINEAHESFRTTLTESMNRSRRDSEALWKEIRRLNRKIDNLRQLITEFELQRSGLLLVSLVQFFIIIYLFWGIKRDQKKLEERFLNNTLSSLDYDSLQRKRSNPEVLRKVKRKRKRKDVQTSTPPINLDPAQVLQPVPIPIIPSTNNLQLRFKPPEIPQPLQLQEIPPFNSLSLNRNNKPKDQNYTVNCETDDTDDSTVFVTSTDQIQGFHIGTSGEVFNGRPNTPTKRKTSTNKFKSFFNFHKQQSPTSP